MHHLARYELGDGEGDDLGHAFDVGDHAARLCTRKTIAVSSQAQLNLVRVDRADVEVMATFVAPVVPRQSSSGALLNRSASGLKRLSPHSSAIAGRVGSVQSCTPTSAT